MMGRKVNHELEAQMAAAGAVSRGVNTAAFMRVEMTPENSVPTAAPKKPRGRELVSPSFVVEFTLPIVVVSEANRHESVKVSSRRHKNQQAELDNYVLAWLYPFRLHQLIPCSVLFTRVGGPAMDSGDNANMAFKWLRDRIASRMGVDDSDGSGVTWEYGPYEPGPRQGIRIRITKTEG